MAHRASLPNVKSLRRVLKRHPEIEAAYLYGSYARGQAHARSDLDVAVLLRRRARRSYDATPGYLAELATEIGAAVGHPCVEVVTLDDASPLLAWEVVRHGRRLFAQHPHAIIDYELHVRRRYLDTQHLRAIQDAYLERIIAAGFSKAAGR